jgi:hypothetical protein
MKNVSPMDKEIVNGKIDSGEVKVKKAQAQRKPKIEKPKAEQVTVEKGKEAKIAVEHEKLEFMEAQIVAAVKSVGHAASSREISDKLGIADPEQGRGYVRTRMLSLVKDGKIVTSKPDKMSRCTFLYSVAQ